MQVADDVAQASAKAGSKSAGLITANTAFLVVDCIDWAFTIRDLIENKGSEAAGFLRRKAKELEDVLEQQRRPLYSGPVFFNEVNSYDLVRHHTFKRKH